jgi:hypothetical protein
MWWHASLISGSSYALCRFFSFLLSNALVNDSDRLGGAPLVGPPPPRESTR